MPSWIRKDKDTGLYEWYIDPKRYKFIQRSIMTLIIFVMFLGLCNTYFRNVVPEVMSVPSIQDKQRK